MKKLIKVRFCVVVMMFVGIVAINAETLYDAINSQDINFIKNYQGNVNIFVDNSNTALIWAITKWNGNPALARALLEKGANPNQKDESFTAAPPIFFASGNSNKQIVILLLKSGADVNETCGGQWPGRTALMAAAEVKNTEIIKLLLAAGADVSLKQRNGETALSIARKNNYQDVATILINAGEQF